MRPGAASGSATSTRAPGSHAGTPLPPAGSPRRQTPPRALRCRSPPPSDLALQIYPPSCCRLPLAAIYGGAWCPCFCLGRGGRNQESVDVRRGAAGRAPDTSGLAATPQWRRTRSSRTQRSWLRSRTRRIRLIAGAWMWRAVWSAEC
ncbi:hypothetical protein PVAP13_2NG316900 [Panicum virgatum]|uniref:Uncharacterized protein n=1 Tax=Panicum virgatum TaxID=38727 RepID=A0A8T0VCG0_PANVG|nr:hypothetical protein PVAP13_2NG316900 [Panicum virgatum]